ncbi:hypothetical protein DLAC_03244 [Tieghemostelium lacteum]|uniref:Uncharacterized protein n=1 Tax=Tieghemostelium lacteum TaxID=361077 RepID=A0A152A1H4_TIELA|nr:hypothetical protein DLAC_03244 [Tieghemostelium lacteum]|eukprot:KYR00098.1 hypothetical protein DLAC_03244 [Tieghemostelium lacteum]
METIEGKIPSIIVLGFKDSGKSSLYFQMKKDESKKYAFIFDHETLPKSILDEAKEKNYPILDQESTIKLPNGSVCCLLMEHNVVKVVLPGNFDRLVFVSDDFEGSFLFELISSVEEGPLADLADRLMVENTVCLIDSKTILSNLKSMDILSDRYNFEMTESNREVVVSEKSKSSDCCKEKSDCCDDKSDCCDDKSDCCKPTKKEEKKKQDKCCDHDHDHDHDNEDETMKASERRVSTVILSQVQSSQILLLNKTDLVSKEELQYIEDMLTFVSTSRIIRTTHAAVDIETLFTDVPIIKSHDEVTGSGFGLLHSNFYQRIPFHPTRLFNCIFRPNEEEKCIELKKENFKGIIWAYSKMWLATDMECSYTFDLLEEHGDFNMGPDFYAANDGSDTYSLYPTVDELIKKEISSNTYGDRASEMSILADSTFNVQLFNEVLRKCLLTPEEFAMGPEKWATFDNPFEDFVEFDGEFDDELDEDEDEEDEVPTLVNLKIDRK